MAEGRGCYLWDAKGNRYLDALSGLFTVQLGHGRADLAEAAPRAGRDARVLPDLELRAPAGDRARGEARRARARRPQPRVLHHRRLRGGRVGVEARPPVLPGDRSARAATRSSPARPPTTAPRWARSRSPASPRCSEPFEPLTPGTSHVMNTNRFRHELEDDEAAFMKLADRRDRAADPGRGPGDGRRGVPRAGAERGRLLRAAGRLLPAGARDLRPLRRAARLGRGHLRVRAARHDVRLASATTTCPT